MPDNKRTEAQPIKKIIDRETGAHVGWLYEWNTGDLVPMWCNGPKDNVRYEDIPPGEMPHG
ncbi:hypothetical protein [Roseobacter sp. A03A-229]